MSLPQRLREGYATFRGGRLAAEQSRYRDLAERGQTPETMVIGCCDSRVSPEVIFDAGPGELFVVRNVANLVPPYSPDGAYHGVSAALEYAVEVLRRAAHRRARPCPLRRRPRLRRRRGARRFSRQMDVVAGAGGGDHRAARRSAGQLSDTARAGFDAGVAAEPADVSLHPHAAANAAAWRCTAPISMSPRANCRRSMPGDRTLRPGHAAFFFAAMSLRLIRHSAIWMALSAAPLRRLSETTHSTRPLSTVGSSRMRLI